METLHWIRDGTFDEDPSRMDTQNAPRAMVRLRNLEIRIRALPPVGTASTGRVRSQRPSPPPVLLDDDADVPTGWLALTSGRVRP